MTPLRFVPILGFQNYMFDQLEIQKRLSTLKFDLYRLRRTAKSEINGLVRHRGSHIESDPVLALAGDLAIFARVVASEGHDKHVQAREFGDTVTLGSHFKRKKVQCDIGITVLDKMFGF
jgi:hypothetical protein